MPELKAQAREVWRLSLPAILTQITTIAMQYIDSAMVGALGANASASIGLVSTSTWLIGGIIGGVSAGFSVQASHRIGGGDDRGARTVVRHGLVTGMLIAAGDLKSIVCSRPIWKLAAVRMLVIPALCLGAFALLGLFRFGMAAQVVLLLECCPAAAITSVFAVQFGHDEQFAAGCVVLTTLLSILTLPLCALVLTMA